MLHIILYGSTNISHQLHIKSKNSKMYINGLVTAAIIDIQ